jgi:CRP-like cAMP-binding protein
VELAGRDDGLAQLRAGEAIGDAALIGDFPQPATVSAPYGLRAMKLTREAFRAVLDRFPGALSALREAAQHRKSSVFHVF